MRHPDRDRPDSSVRLPRHWNVGSPRLPGASVFVSEAGLTVVITVECVAGEPLRVARVIAWSRELTDADLADVRATFFVPEALVNVRREPAVPNVVRLTAELPN